MFQIAHGPASDLGPIIDGHLHLYLLFLESDSEADKTFGGHMPYPGSNPNTPVVF